MERWEFDPNNIVPYNFQPRHSHSRSSTGESGEGGSGGGDTAGAAASVSPPAEPETIAAVSQREWDETDEETVKWRLQHFVWCRCGGKCRQMKTGRESVCCHDLVEAEMKGVGRDILCVTEEKSFNVVVLNKCVLKAAMVANFEVSEERKEDGDGYYDNGDGDDDAHIDDDEDEALEVQEVPEVDNRAYRAQAYRQCCLWLHNWDGEEACVRRVIPSCVVQAINKAYPDPSGEFKGHYEDEGYM